MSWSEGGGAALGKDVGGRDEGQNEVIGDHSSGEHGRSAQRGAGELAGQLGGQLGGERGGELSGELGEQLSGELGGQLSGERGRQLSGERGGQLSGDPGGPLGGGLSGDLSVSSVPTDGRERTSSAPAPEWTAPEWTAPHGVDPLRVDGLGYYMSVPDLKKALGKVVAKDGKRLSGIRKVKKTCHATWGFLYLETIEDRTKALEALDGITIRPFVLKSFESNKKERSRR